MPEREQKKGLKEALRRIEEAKKTGGEELDLTDLGLVEIPKAVSQLPNLRCLDLRHNLIKTIPDLLGLPRLHKLVLNANEFVAIPESIAQFSELQELDFTGNNITYVSESIAQLRELNVLGLGGNYLKYIADGILQARNLQILYLWQNEISAIPDTVIEHSQLRVLALNSNLVSVIPDSIGQLTQLQQLNLANNRITVISNSIGELSQLQQLNLADNKITVIPDSIGQLSQLQQLSLAGNKITVIPDPIGQLTQLQHLGLAYNQIAAIPDSVAQLLNLERIELNDNCLTTISQQLVKLHKLRELRLRGNPALGIPEEILQFEYLDLTEGKSPQTILAYLAKLAEGQPLNEAKLILVGQGAVGKTSLVKMLTTGKFKKGEESTEGIKISDWECPLGREDTAKVHIWDFGGQELMHATHQFFLTQRSLYLLVLNRRTGGVDREADYWFRLIRAFGGTEAPVIVVLNKQESEPFDVNREGWLKKYRGNLKGFVATDCEDAETITELRRKIVKELNHMESLKARFPRRWFAIKDEISSMTKEHISFEEYRKLCRKRGEEDPDNQKLLAGFLHDLGIALNYSQDPKLRFNYVLKPEWVTQGIYALLHAFVAQKGVFTPAQAESALDKKKYSAEDTHFMLGLMERFELSFPLGDKQNRVLIPELLEDAQAKEASLFKPEECLNFGYKYSVLPEGLLPRFIARTHHLSKAETRWKSGVILEDSSTGCRGLVVADAADAEVRIHIDGPKNARSELLGIVRFNFEVIHSDYESKPVPQVYPEAAPEKALSLPELEAMARSRATSIPVVLPNATVINQDIAALVEPLGPVPTPLKLFLSYSHKDEEHINELRKDLKLMEMNGLVQPWYDRGLTAGEQWELAILESLKAADIVVCQISRDYLFSDNCRKELSLAIERNRAHEAALAAYILNDCGWKELSELSQIQVLPKDGKPLVDWPDRNKYWRAVIEGLQETIKKLQAERRNWLRAARN